MHWIKGQRRGGQKKRPAHIYLPEKIGGKHLYSLGLDRDSGIDILWQTDEQPGTIEEISQIIILDADDNAVEHIPIPAEITTGREMVEVLFKRRDATFIEVIGYYLRHSSELESYLARPREDIGETRRLNESKAVAA